MTFQMPHKLSLVLNDRTSGSVALLNHLMDALEEELRGPAKNAVDFSKLLLNVRVELKHFAAIENFLASLIRLTGRQDAFPGEQEAFPGEVLRFIAEYRLYWQDSAGKIAEHFLQLINPKDKTILTHSHSQTVISLLEQLHLRQVPFRVLQTLSSPGEEGKISHERMRRLKLHAELITDADMKEAIRHSDLVLMGCDALLKTEFLNKIGTRAILEEAAQGNKRSFLVTESRKEIGHPGWKNGWTGQPLFEWVPLDLIDRIVTERGG